MNRNQDLPPTKLNKDGDPMRTIEYIRLNRVCHFELCYDSKEKQWIVIRWRYRVVQPPTPPWYSDLVIEKEHAPTAIEALCRNIQTEIEERLEPMMTEEVARSNQPYYIPGKDEEPDLDDADQGGYWGVDHQ